MVDGRGAMRIQSQLSSPIDIWWLCHCSSVDGSKSVVGIKGRLDCGIEDECGHDQMKTNVVGIRLRCRSV